MLLERVLKEREKNGMDDAHIAYLGGSLVGKTSILLHPLRPC